MTRPWERFGIKQMLGLVALCAVLAWAWKTFWDSQPPYLYARRLARGNDASRLEAAGELRWMSEVVVVPALARALLSDPSAAVRRQAAISLATSVARRGEAETTALAVSAFCRALADGDSTVRRSAADGLGRIVPGPEPARSALLRIAGDGDEWVRGAAVASLGLIQGKAGGDHAEVRRAIIAAMNDPSLHVRELGLYAFWAAAVRTPEFTVAVLDDGDVRARRAAIAALARNSPLVTPVVARLAHAASDTAEDPAVRVGAARLLQSEEVITPAILEALTRARDDPDVAVRAGAASALRTIEARADRMRRLRAGSGD